MTPAAVSAPAVATMVLAAVATPAVATMAPMEEMTAPAAVTTAMLTTATATTLMALTKATRAVAGNLKFAGGVSPRAFRLSEPRTNCSGLSGSAF